MSSLALMRWLESAPQRYDAGMRWLTLGRVARLHTALARAVAGAPGRHVLEVGCGTGAVTEHLVAEGARVTALDQNPEMLEQARSRLAAPASGAMTGQVTWLERTASEIDALPAASFDAAVASLCLSEMSAGERAFVLRQLSQCLRAGGVLAVADEVRPTKSWQRVFHALMRAPQAVLRWLLAGSTSRPISDLAGEIQAAGFTVREEKRWLLGRLAAVTAERPR